jgi:formamidopyrimidine-DNA glycosylase
MTGSLLIKPAEEEPEKFVRLVIRLNSGKAIHFRDVRRFGRMWLANDVNSVVGDLGIEPLTPELSPVLLGQLLKIARRRLNLFFSTRA